MPCICAPTTTVMGCAANFGQRNANAPHRVQVLPVALPGPEMGHSPLHSTAFICQPHSTPCEGNLERLHNLVMTNEEALKVIKDQVDKEKTKNTLVIFIDGSIIPGVGGGAAAITEKLWAKAPIVTLVIFCDSQQALLVLHEPSTMKSNHYIMLSLKELVSNLKPDTYINLYWIPKCSDINLHKKYNEEAHDKKKAAQLIGNRMTLQVPFSRLTERIKTCFNVHSAQSQLTNWSRQVILSVFPILGTLPVTEKR
ncbi:hypothetical protein CROQUDRAFT_136463 [Cronartium quercuum f. sp. fusiforme G11]|uniref:Uncharacterized protein n=1 Tax=Cronartium quercuum f. sp. fusiforme G11 TaxID=708437 RepID=A0A9P6NBS9_9BASI|nr:hypothetical protein CROQUDRAFT_136463 [Cronartium quercuum f. sp. fusiforme G11]